MILDDVDYDYDMKKAKFDSINYYFKFDSEEFTSEDFSQLFKVNLAILEELIENNFFEGNFKKEDNGNMTSSSISIGQRYVREFKNKFLQSLRNVPRRDYNESVYLYYNTNVYNEQVSDLKLNLRSVSSTQKPIFDLYDSILTIPQLDLSTRASKNIRNIDIIRKENFNPKRGLELLTSK